MRSNGVRHLLIITCCLAANIASAAQVVTEPFLGVRHIFQTESSPRPLKIHVVEIDLTAPGIGFMVTPPSSLPNPPFINGTFAETNLQTTRNFANAVGAQVAINGAFFASSGSWAQNLGLTASNGNEYSPWEGGAYNNNDFDDALHISPTNIAQIVKMPHSIPTGWETNPSIPRDDLYNAITGSHRIVQNGAAVTITGGSGSPLSAQPRTAVGLTAGNSKLILMTIDGRQTGVSEGLTLSEMANLMIGAYGVQNAINLDGGGSTTMVMDFYDDSFASQVVNVPSDGNERAVGTNLAVFALPNGDFNRNGDVEAGDYVAWRKTIGGSIAYDAWRKQFSAEGDTGGGTSVPEPKYTSVLLIAASFHSCRTRRRCR